MPRNLSSASGTSRSSAYFSESPVTFLICSTLSALSANTLSDSPEAKSVINAAVKMLNNLFFLLLTFIINNPSIIFLIQILYVRLSIFHYYIFIGINS